MLFRAPDRSADSSPYWAERTQSWRSGCPGTSMSDAHNARHAAVCEASSASHPRRAARTAASCAADRGSDEVRVVSTPTYLVAV